MHRLLPLAFASTSPTGRRASGRVVRAKPQRRHGGSSGGAGDRGSRCDPSCFLLLHLLPLLLYQLSVLPLVLDERVHVRKVVSSCCPSFSSSSFFPVLGERESAKLFSWGGSIFAASFEEAAARRREGATRFAPRCADRPCVRCDQRPARSPSARVRRGSSARPSAAPGGGTPRGPATPRRRDACAMLLGLPLLQQSQRLT